MTIIETLYEGEWMPKYLIVDGEPVRLRKNPFHCQKEGIWMSVNGAMDYGHGGRPLFMWDLPLEELEPMIPHHIGQGNEERCTFELLMFYRRKTYLQERAKFWMEADLKSREITNKFLMEVKE